MQLFGVWQADFPEESLCSLIPVIEEPWLSILQEILARCVHGLGVQEYEPPVHHAVWQTSTLGK